MARSPFLDSVYRYMITRHYSKRSVATYLYWIKYFIIFHKKRHPADMHRQEVTDFLAYLSVERKVSASTQQLVLTALAFLYNKYFEKPLGNLGDFSRGHAFRKIPVVLTREEIRRLLACLSPGHRLMASLLYGSGLRRIELVRLRLKDIDLEHLQLRIWFSKGIRHRVTTLAPELVPDLSRQIERVRLLLQEDLENPA